MSPTPPIAVAATPHKVGNIPETLGVLLGAMEVRKRFIDQTYYINTEEYWSCMRDLANLERRWAEAEKVWAQHVAKETAR